MPGHEWDAGALLPGKSVGKFAGNAGNLFIDHQYGVMTFASGDVITEHGGDGYLALRGLAERDADGVAQALGQEGADAYGALDAPVLAGAGFGDAEVQGVVHALGLHADGEHAHGIGHDHGVAGLDGDDDVVEVVAAGYVEVFHDGFGHAQGCVAVAHHDAVAEGAVVNAQTQCRAVLPAEVEQGHELGLHPVEGGDIFLGGELAAVVDHAWLVGKVAGVDAHLVGSDGGCHGRPGVKVDIGHEGYVASLLFEEFPHLAESLGLAYALSGDTHDLATGVGNADGLRGGGIHVEARRVGHGLQTHRIVAAHVHAADADDPGRATLVVVPHCRLVGFVLVMDAAELVVGFYDLLLEALLVLLDSDGHLVVGDGQDLAGEDGSVECAVYAYGGDGDAGRHLHDGQQGVEAVEAAADGHADDGQCGEGGDDTAEVGGHAGTCDDDLDAAGASPGGELLDLARGAVCRQGEHLEGNLKLLEVIGGFLHHGQIRGAAHDYADDRCHESNEQLTMNNEQ